MVIGRGLLVLFAGVGLLIFLFPPTQTVQTVTGTTSTGAQATFVCNGMAGCCCNTPTSTNGTATPANWNTCAVGTSPVLDCVALAPGGVVHPTAGIIDVQVCKEATPLAAPAQIASGQPAFCRVDLAP